ncbi:hypothetical protein LEP1GSC051_2176 [Leptospira sp. P2653]|nr:hypothetical protein LEP1GSC051_2176 [Leptospira sp. P2653]
MKMRKNFLKVGVPTFRICSSSHILRINLQSSNSYRKMNRAELTLA